jgi:hypothetical protein
LHLIFADGAVPGCDNPVFAGSVLAAAVTFSGGWFTLEVEGFELEE